MDRSEKNNIKLTQFSHGAGCGCKISPQALNVILNSDIYIPAPSNLITGNESRDDAAVMDMGNGTAIISTTDFFTPVVDDPFTFGQIAAANAISDVFAMGGKPIMAIAILGWPVNVLSPDIAREVVDGGRQICKEVGIPLAGGHSIDSPEPIFGLAVTGQVDTHKIKRNDTATEGCQLFLTKPLGVGILTTAQKMGVLQDKHAHIAPDLMRIINSLGYELAQISGVKAMTDVTGFGFLGHLTEICEGSNLSAHIYYNKIPKLSILDPYLEQKCFPGGTLRNWKSYGKKVRLKDEANKNILCDPQTNGGLLIAVEPDSIPEVQKLFKASNIKAEALGQFVKKEDLLITVF